MEKLIFKSFVRKLKQDTVLIENKTSIRNVTENSIEVVEEAQAEN